MGNGARERQVEGELVKPVESGPADRISRRAALGALAVLAWEARALAQTPPGGAAPAMPAGGGGRRGGRAGLAARGEDGRDDDQLLPAPARHAGMAACSRRTAPSASRRRRRPRRSSASRLLAADTQVDKGARQVTLENLRIEKVHFPSATSQEAAYQKLLEQHVPPRVRTIELDRLETALSMREQQEKGESKPFKNDPPRILFSTIPAILILIDGEPELPAGAGRHLRARREHASPPAEGRVRHPLPPALRRLDDRPRPPRDRGASPTRCRVASSTSSWRGCRRLAPSISSPSSTRRTRRAGPRWPRDPSRPSWWHPSPRS